MKRTILQMATEFRQHWKNYVIQSVLATLVLLVALWVLSVQRAVIVASLGATAFIVFAMPSSLTARPRHVIGGHLVGLLCGTLCSLAAPPGSPYAVVACAAASGTAMFVMVVTDTEHPPAAGTALGIALLGYSWPAVVAVTTGALLLSLAHGLLRRFLRDLT